MVDSVPPEPSSAEPASPPEPPQLPPDEPLEPVPTDFRRNAWLLIIILGVIVLAWIAAIVWRRMSAPGIALLPAPEVGTPRTPKPNRPKRAAPVELSRVVGSGTETILAAPAVLLRPAGTRYRLERLFDVTERAEGFALSELLRLPDSWLDDRPMLVLDGPSSPGTVSLQGLLSPGPELRLLLLESPDGLRAYPVALFHDFLALRDRIGDRSVVISWSSLSQTAHCMVADLDGQDVTWGDSGLIYRGDDVLYDAESGSLWDPSSGRAVTGPLAGSTVPTLPLTVWPWEACQARHPDALLPNLQPGKDVPEAQKKRVQDMVEAYLASPVLPFEPSRFDPADSPLPAKEFVLGVRIADEARAYPIRTLASAGVEALTDSLAGQSIEVHVTSPRTAYVTSDGRPVDAVVRLWFAWVEVCPDTSVYAVKPPDDDAP